MGVIELDPKPLQRRDAAFEGEHPRVVVSDIMHRARPKARIITIANEKGGAGKSTVAFHLCVALADAGRKVLAIDLDRRQRTLSNALTNREGTARRLNTALPTPRHLVLGHDSGSMLLQEMVRVGHDCDTVVIDAPGYDSPIARRAIALADTLVTPVNGSFADVDLLGRFSPVSMKYSGPGCFAELVDGIRKARFELRQPALDWLVVMNRVRKGGSRCQTTVEHALAKLEKHIGFRMVHGLADRVAYRELIQLGLTHLDLKRIPQLPRTHSLARDEILNLRDKIFTTGAFAGASNEDQFELI
jgi:chromosome partitioning protein